MLSSKGNSNQFDSQDDISLESVSIRTSIGSLNTYVDNMKARIDEIFAILGTYNSSTGMM